VGYVDLLTMLMIVVDNDKDFQYKTFHKGKIMHIRGFLLYFQTSLAQF